MWPKRIHSTAAEDVRNVGVDAQYISFCLKYKLPQTMARAAASILKSMMTWNRNADSKVTSAGTSIYDLELYEAAMKSFFNRLPSDVKSIFFKENIGTIFNSRAGIDEKFDTLALAKKFAENFSWGAH